jgi:hypothetical protein
MHVTKEVVDDVVEDDRPMKVVLKVKIVQEYKEPKVEMYKPI